MIIPEKYQVKPLTVWVWCLTECEEVYNRIVHLQHSSTLPVHYRQTRPPAHRVVRQTTRKDYEGLPGTHTSIDIKKQTDSSNTCIYMKAQNTSFT